MGLLEIIGIRKKGLEKSNSPSDASRSEVGLVVEERIVEEKAIPLGGDKYIEVPIPIAIGPHIDTGIHKRGNEFRDRDLDVGRYIKLNGYRGAFEIINNRDAWDGMFHLSLKRADPPRDYKQKVVLIENYRE